MSAQERLDELHHRMAVEVKALLGDAAMAITVISISEKPAGQMVLCDVDRHAKGDTAARLRIAANCLAPMVEQTATSPLSRPDRKDTL
jgi:hypothetical protein